MNHFTAILDYDVGNLKSVTNAMRYLGFDTRITSDPAELERADAIILPGVGAFPDAAEKLRVPGLDKTLLTQAEKKPILGICLGMQLLFDRGEEIRPCAGLGLVHGSVRRLETDRKLPHIGWNSLHLVRPENPLMANTREGDFVYFVHSFYVKGCGDALVAGAEYGVTVPGAVARGNVYGCQFHPEKSGEAGLRILRAFAAL